MQFPLITPVSKAPRRQPPTLLLNPTLADIKTRLPEDPLIGLDLETTGLDPMEDSIIGIGWASQSSHGYLDIRNLNKAAWHALEEWLSAKQIVCHNSLFDQSFLETHFRRPPRLSGDTLVLWKVLDTGRLSGFTLDNAIKYILNWPSNNKTTLSQLLEKHKLKKGEMGKLADLEPTKFAEYCALDAEACWQLNQVLRAQGAKPHLDDTLFWYDTQYMNLERRVVEQQLRGVRIDRPRAEALKAELEQESADILSQFRAHHEVAAFLTEFECEAEVHTIRQKRERKIRAKKSDEPWNHTDMWVRELRTPSSKWEQEYGCWCRHETSVKLTHKTVPEVKFNPNSKPHLRELFYGWLEYEPEEYTPSGIPKVDKKVLPKLGEPGELLVQYNKVMKLLGYVNSLLDKLTPDGILHYRLRVHGTLTGRSAGAGGAQHSTIAQG